MDQHVKAGTVRKVIVAGVAALSLMGFAQGISPAQAMPISPAVGADASEGSGIADVHYRPYRHYHRRYTGYRRAYRGVPVPCRGKGFISKRYC